MKKILVMLFISLLVVFSSSKVMAAVDYKLPYPGILPNNPIWPVKDLRDTVMGLFIFDPVLKAQYNLHLADKRFAAGLALNDPKVEAWAYPYLEEAAKNKAVYPQVSLALMKYEEELGTKSPNPDFVKTKERVTKLFIDNLKTISNP